MERNQRLLDYGSDIWGTARCLLYLQRLAASCNAKRKAVFKKITSSLPLNTLADSNEYTQIDSSVRKQLVLEGEDQKVFW